MKNADLRDYAKSKGVKLYEVAQKFGVVDNTFSRWLRKEFEPEKQAQFRNFVDEIARER